MLYTAKSDIANSVNKAVYKPADERLWRFIKLEAVYLKTVGGGTEPVNVVLTNGTDSINLNNAPISVTGTTTTFLPPADTMFTDEWWLEVQLTNTTPADDVYVGFEVEITNLWNKDQRLTGKYTVTGGTPMQVYQIPYNKLVVGGVMVVDTSGAANNVNVEVAGLVVRSATVNANGVGFIDITTANNENQPVVIDAAGNCDVYLVGYLAGENEFVK